MLIAIGTFEPLDLRNVLLGVRAKKFIIKLGFYNIDNMIVVSGVDM